VRRSPLLTVTLHCPRLERPVHAQRNTAIDRLVACDGSEECRDPAPATPDGREHARPFPRGCPVFPSLAK
jgi:hypothetical protein